MRRRPRCSPRLLAATLALLATLARPHAARADVRSTQELSERRDRLMAQRNGVVAVLGAWSALNLAAGALLVADPSWIPRVAPTRPERRAFGVATLVFAAANAAFFAAGAARTSILRDSLTDVPSIARERRTTGDFFAVNAGLDMLYISGGALLYYQRAGSPILRGFGAGVLAQGGFLIGFDTTAMLYRHGDR